MAPSLVFILYLTVHAALGEPSAPIRDASDYRSFYREPSGCEPDNCDIFVGIDTNEKDESFLDFYLVCKAEGWVAVGFSETSSKFKIGVVGCSVEREDGTQILVTDTYNTKEEKYNDPDNSETDTSGHPSDVVTHSVESENGRIRCVFSRKTVGLDPDPQDLLLNKNLYLEFGQSNQGRDSGDDYHLLYHDLGTPVISFNQYNPSISRGEIVNSRQVRNIVEDERLPTPPTRNASEYRLRYREPDGCQPDDCDYFVGIDTNEGDPSFLDFYLIGKATGWVAVGFSTTANMLKTDVVGCSVDHGATFVLALDTYNPPDVKTNKLDESEEKTNGAPDIVTYNREYTDKTIKCIFSREIEGVDPYPEDLLLNMSYYLQFGRSSIGRADANASEFAFHDIGTPTISKEMYNPATSRGDIGVSTLGSNLIIAHGVLMLVAWPLLSFMALFFAAWMKPALPNGQWFQVMCFLQFSITLVVHRAFNLASLLVAVVGFALVFVAHRDESPPGLIDLGTGNKIGTAHFAFGVVIMTLQILNPLISLCRCKPNDKLRWIFTLVHGLIIGYGVQVLAYVSMGLGMARYDKELTDQKDKTLVWIYVAIAVFSLLFTLGLFLLFSGEAVIFKIDARSTAPTVVGLLWKNRSEYADIQVTEKETGVYSSTPETRPLLPSSPSTSVPKTPSADAPLRWVALIIALVILFPAVVVLIVLMITRSNLL